MYALTLILAFVSEGVQPPISVVIRSPRAEYLVGEPVPVEMSWRNETRSPISFAIEPFGGHASLSRLLIALDGKAPHAVDIEEGCPEGRFLDVMPGAALNYTESLLWSRSNRGLFFDRPGCYTIRIVSPLQLQGKPKAGDIESNVVRILVRDPEGEDAEVGRLVRAHPLALDYVQHPRDQMPGYDKAMVRLVVDVLAEHPRSRYSAIYEPAVRYFFEREQPVIPPGDRKTFRELLKVPTSPVFPDDARLEATVVVETQEDLARFLQSLGRQSGVPLRASLSLGKEGWFRARNTVVLRSEMESLAETRGAEWRKSKDGYLLERRTP